MEEITKLHNLNLEWGCITNLIDKIGDMEDKIEGGWPELIDMVVDAMSEEGEAKRDPADLFFDLYQYLFRLYYRLKMNPVKRPFNIIRKSETEEAFILTNYDYTTFKWVKAIGCGDRISNDYVIIPTNKLSDKQRRAFERKAQ